MKAPASREAASRPRPDRASRAHERAADRAADRALGSADGFAHRARIPAAPRAGLGAGHPLPATTRAHFERRLGADLSAVRLHTDAGAGHAARREGAAAFAIGTDIAFAPGRYAPETAEGKRLLAHELAHVVQQGGGAPALGLGAAPLGIQRAVETLGGTWDTDRYELTYNDATGAHRGCVIDLRFTPGEAVDASKIGLVQSVNSIRNGAVFPIHETAARRSIPAGEPEAGLQIDRLADKRNPVYGMNDPASASGGLGDSESAGNSQWGWRYRRSFFGFSWPSQRDATLHDAPALGGHGPNSSQLFETTALAVEGTQAGTFYGSVRWGWRSDASNVPTLEPLAVVSVGAPSAGFRRTSDIWNRTRTSEGETPLQLPIAAGSSGTRLPRDMSTSEIEDRLRAIAVEREQARFLRRLPGPFAIERTTETLDFEERALRQERFRRMGDFPTPRRDGTALA